MSANTTRDIPRHVAARLWANELDESFRWLEPDDRDVFITRVLSLLVDDAGPDRIASDIFYASESFAEDLLERLDAYVNRGEA
jgi:hypothetical protein